VFMTNNLERISLLQNLAIFSKLLNRIVL